VPPLPLPAREVQVEQPSGGGTEGQIEEERIVDRGKSALAKAIRYATSRWTELTRYLEDGRLEIDNNIAERAMRTIAVGRRNWLFAGSDAGGGTAAAFYTLIESVKLNGHNPRVWLTRVLETIGRDQALTGYDALLPWVMTPEHPNA
jgi:hypothetical protein